MTWTEVFVWIAFFGVYVLGNWQGYRTAREEQRFKDDIDYTMKLAMEVGRREAAEHGTGDAQRKEPS